MRGSREQGGGELRSPCGRRSGAGRAEREGGRARGVGGRRERGREKRKEKKKMGKKEKKKREGKGGIRADAMRPRPATRDGRVRSAGFAAWSMAGRPRVRRAERRMGQRVFGTEK